MSLVSCKFWIAGALVISLKTSIQGQFTYSPEDITACAGDEILLDWQYTGNPIIKHCHKDGNVDVVTIISSPMVHSTYDGRLLYNGQGNITILNVRTSDSGTYVFEILYDLNKLYTDAVQVRVFDSIRNPPQIQYDNIANILSCTLEGNAHDTSFTWKVNGEVIATKSEISPTIRGLYSCNTSSVQTQACLMDGVSSTANLNLTIGVPIVVARFPLVKARNQSPATLECYTEVSIPFVTKWKWHKKGNEDRILSDGSSLVFPYVIISDDGWYECIATNAIGDSDPVTIALKVGNVTDQSNHLDTANGNDTILIISLVLGSIVISTIAAATGCLLYKKRCKNIERSDSKYFDGSHFDMVSTITADSTFDSGTTSIHYHEIRNWSNISDTGSSSYASVNLGRPISEDVDESRCTISSEGTNSYMEWTTR